MRARVCLALLVMLSAAPAAALPVLTIQPSSASVTAGNTFALDVVATDVADLIGFEFDIGFDQAFFSALNVTEGALLASAGTTVFLPGSIDNPSGTVSFTAGSLIGAITGASGSGVLATLTFNALAPVVASPMTIFNVTLLDSSFGAITTTTQGGSITVTAPTSVPEPSTLWWMAAGLAGAWRWRRRSHRG